MRIIILVACLWLATSPLQGKIVFYSTRDGNEEIYKMNSDGSNQTRLTFNEASDSYPVWSPDGRQIAFESNRDGNYEIYVMDAEGTNQRRLTDHPAWDMYPDWSPNGNQIAFISDRNGGPNHEWNIFVIDTEGSNVRQVTNGVFAEQPKWSPDGKWILFRTDEKIFAIRAGGTDLWEVNEPKPDTGCFLGGWSPDGKQILYVEEPIIRDPTFTPVIATLHPAKQQQVFKRVRVKMPLKAFRQTSFSADGKSIFGNSKQNGNTNIYRFGLVDKHLIQLTDTPGRDAAPQEWDPRLSVPLQGLTSTCWGEIKTIK